MAKTAAQKNRSIRQDSLREWLSKKCTAQHLVDNIEKIEGLDPECESFVNELAKRKVANEQRLKIMNKYLPDLSHTSIEGDSEDGSITINLTSYASNPAK
jgi:hypothetical protein